MEHVLHPVVLSELRRKFPADAARVAEELLRTTELYLDRVRHRLERARVHMGALRYANGDLGRLRAILRSPVDYRDVLMASGLAHEDWRDVLRGSGLEVPE